MMDKDSKQYQKLLEYNGKYCRVFLMTLKCLVGYITLVDDWVLIERSPKERVLAQLQYVVSISEYEPHNFSESLKL